MTHVGELQEAVNNHGRVQLFQDGGRSVAVKRMPTRWVCSGPREFDAQHTAAFERPWFDIGLLRLLNGVQYPYACRLHGIFRSDVETFVATTFCDGGDLFEWCFRESLPAPGAEREALMQPIAKQLVDAVRWLHDLGIAHRDLSLENAMLVRSGGEEQVKLIDFGMATLARTARNEARGKLAYQAPEIHGDAPVDTFLADNFALGVMLFVMDVMDYPWACTTRGKCPLFDYFQMFGIRRFVAKRRLRRGGSGQLMGEAISKDFLALLEALLRLAPRKRASLGEATFADEARVRRRTVVSELPYFTTPPTPRRPCPAKLDDASSPASTCASRGSSNSGSAESSSTGATPRGA